ncbi:MAG: hypothetical protein A7315_11005 [Candidatus Altiarchaeales archaeon WOR_SM1_79]|nr:MAG: hypothetical protein A7315_11005 [Candidatus Altiarchaeales archaeon WOR_SM1_79]
MKPRIIMTCMITQLTFLLFIMVGHASAWGPATHVAQYDAILAELEDNPVYHLLLTNYPTYFKYGCMFPDIREWGQLGPVIEEMFQDIEDVGGVSLTYSFTKDPLNAPQFY